MLVKRSHELIRTIRNSMINLNLFNNSSRNSDVVRRQRITTWAFIILLILILFILGIYWLASTQTKTITILHPLQADYDYLWETHSHTLQCPCSETTIPHSEFIYLEPSFHHICSSRITSPDWYEQLLAVGGNTGAPSQFERNLGGKYFQALNTFCSLAKNFTADAYQVFSSTLFINSYVVHSSILNQQMSVRINAFIESTRIQFNRIFTFIHDINHIDQLASRALSNSVFGFRGNDTLVFLESSLTRLNPEFPLPLTGECRCMTENLQCGAYIQVYLPNVQSTYYLHPRLVQRCLLTDSVLTSSLECWYDLYCFSIVCSKYQQLGIYVLVDDALLNPNITSRFPRNSLVEDMLTELFIENWKINISYDNFFRSCAPTSCSYNIQQKFDWFFMILNIVGLYGGLSKGLKLFLPIIISLILLATRRFQNRRSVRPVHILQNTNRFSTTDSK